MAANTARVYDDIFADYDPAVREYMDSESDRITADYNNSAAPDYEGYDYGYDYGFDYGQPGPATAKRGLSETEKQVAKAIAFFPFHIAGCVFLVVLSFCMLMFMMIKSVDVRNDLDTNASNLTYMQQEAVRLEAEINGKCELAAVSRFAEDAGLHKASQFQTVYVGGQSESGGIVSNAGPEVQDSGQTWAKLKSFFD